MKTKRGGYQGPEGWVFELTGGALCLDFVNTLDNRPTETPKDRLRTYFDLVGWSAQSGLMDEEQAVRLFRKAEPEPAASHQILLRARSLREALFAIFSSVVHRSAPTLETLAVLNTELPMALSCLAIEKTGDGFQLKGTEKEDALDLMLHRVVRSAVELLTSPDLSRVRVCAAYNCAWLFIDRSRNRTRQWCDMSICGNRAKARRHYRRSKLASSR